jgi:hypothetical protein
VGEALSVELAERVEEGVGSAVTLLLAVCVPDEVGEGVAGGVPLPGGPAVGEAVGDAAPLPVAAPVGAALAVALALTGALAVALRLGALAAGVEADEEVSAVLEAYSRALGIAYQIRDDLEDYTQGGAGAPDDLEAMRPGVVLSAGWERAKGDAKQVLESRWKRESVYDVTAVRAVAVPGAGVTFHGVLQALLELPTPDYWHHDLIRDGDGKRLAKRDDARAIALYRAEGATPADIRRMVGL